MSKWNPLLLENKDKYEKLIIDSSKKQIRNILKSYVGLFDPFCELIQNAMDAVEKRKNSCNETFSCEMYISIDLKENTIYIADNGIGFTDDEFKTFLSPNISYKAFGTNRGNKGVGATYLAFGFYRLEVYTKSSTYTNYVCIDNGHDWVFSEDSSIPVPDVYEKESTDDDFPFDMGSSFKLHLSSANNTQHVSDLSWRGLETAESWYYALLTNTPLGHLDISGTHPTDIVFSIKVIDKSGNITEKIKSKADYYYPHNFLTTTAQKIDDVLEWQKKQLDAGRDASNIPQKYSRKHMIYQFYSNHELLTLADRSKTLTEEEAILLKAHDVVAYGAFANSVKRWDDINEKVIKARKGTKIVAAGLQLATSNMIQGSVLQIPLTSNIGYQKQAQVIIHFTNAEPDLGRKGFQPELRTLAEKISSMIVTLHLKKWKKLLAADEMTDNSDLKKKSNYDYVREMEEYERSYPLRIANKNFFLPSKEISITAKPRSEQDVIVLFSQLIAGGVIRSLELMATSSINQYDGLYRVNIKEPTEMHYYDACKNPLGISRDLEVTPGLNTSPLFLEYKTNFDDLIQDFENEDKLSTDIGLAVVWTLGDRWKGEYQIISTLLPDYMTRRRYHGFTHEIYYDQTGRNKFDCIVLEELIMYLNNPQEYINSFSEKYGDW